ncbi:hypothetical protein [Mucilaginibacter sp. UR6-11]|uniref:hypothetical protein n=1 Tax=Mucilaginibacter sp. UR6-11 TaxID=1435644 RepID=UPI001E2CB164|nr:hypothetical protein [Mucilaginibacter sp. UR6-11]MCC8424354.1 hypothetical protein [Mucilaginibacter sp. UR6-11]
MKAKILLSLFVAVAMLAACKKNNPVITDQPKKLKYLTQVIAVQGAVTTTTYYTYDDNKRLISEKTGDNTTNYIYNGNELFSVEYLSKSGTNTSRSTDELYYADGLVQTLTHKFYSGDGSVTLQSALGFAYNNGKLTETHNDGHLTYYYYEGNNLSKIQHEQYNLTFSYDDRKNKFLNLPAALKNVALQLNKIEYLSSNNITVETDSSLEPGTYTYNYDSDGYPTGATLNYKTNTYLNTKYTYVYKEL